MEHENVRIIGHRGNPEIATVYVGDFGGRLVEFVESRQPPIPWKEKWVLILSVSFGCPIRCAICDAGGRFAGHLTAEQMARQAEFLVRRRYPDHRVPVPKFKVQFARMGEPALNSEVPGAMDRIASQLDAPGLMFCVSTIGPAGREGFFERIAGIKDRFQGRFQLQFSVHSTDEDERDRIMPARKWSLEEIATYGEHFWREGDRKITLNFAVARGMTLSPGKIARIFSPDRFLIKITPVNPTERAAETSVKSAFAVKPDPETERIMARIRKAGFDVLLSVGEIEENRIGSNCGQLVARLSREGHLRERSYGRKYSLACPDASRTLSGEMGREKVRAPVRKRMYNTLERW
jgi:23S rRNA (adenine2503-C2)-methyltransferase